MKKWDTDLLYHVNYYLTVANLIISFFWEGYLDSTNVFDVLLNIIIDVTYFLWINFFFLKIASTE